MEDYHHVLYNHSSNKLKVNSNYISMEYQQKKTQILHEVEYHNLLTFNLVENKLERNFRSIVEALLLAQNSSSEVAQELNQIKKQYGQKFAVLDRRLSELEQKEKSLPSQKLIEKGKNSYKSIEEKEKHDEQNVEKSQREISNHDQQQKSVHESEKKSQGHQEIQYSTQKIENKEESEEWKNVFQIYQKKNQQQHEQLHKLIDELKSNITVLKAEMKTNAQRSNKSIGQQQSSLKNLTSSTNSQKNDQIKDQMEKQLNNMYIEINTLKLCFEQLKQYISESRRKQNKMNSQIDDLQRGLKKLQEDRSNDNENYDKDIKQMKIDILNAQTNHNFENEEQKKKPKKESSDTSENISINYKNGINDRFSKIQATLQNCVTDSELKRFKNEIKDKLKELEKEDENIRKEMKDEFQGILVLFDKKSEQISDLQKKIEDLSEKLNEKGIHFDRKHNICISKIEELKKGLQNLKEDLEFYKSMNQEKPEPKVIVQQVGESDKKTKSADSSGQKEKSLDDLKKYFHHKLHDQRSYLLGMIRDLQRKINGKNNSDQDIVNIWDKLAEVNLFLGKKMNEEDVKKNLLYLQKKLSNLYNHITTTDENNEDARIARTNWFCLSCDKNLQNYQGKIGRHVIWDSLPVKGTGLTRYVKQEKKGLPALKR